MNVRRFVLRLAVGVLCFLVGWGVAALLGVAAPRPAEVPRAVRLELVVPHVEVPHIARPLPPRFELGPPCGKAKMRHAHEWEELRQLEELEMPPLPELERLAPPPPPVRLRRGVN
jgi:hypothetical protein